MSQLKDLAIIMMYIYIFVVILLQNNLQGVFIIGFLGLVLINTKNNNRKLIKKYLQKQREGYINALSHDLRIPVIAQIRALELINNEKFGTLNPTQKDILLQVEESCKCALNLMSLMINTYNMENRSYILKYEKFNIKEVVISCFEELSQKAKGKNITFEYITSGMLNIEADKTELKKVILNVLCSAISNAYTGEKISVTICTSSKNIRLTITGEGENRFYSDTYLSSPYTSVGENIRMGFCKKIIETHKGKILNSGNNNSFSFELPTALV